MSDFNELVGRYIAAWNEPDAGARSRAVAELWTEDGTYTTRWLRSRDTRPSRL